MKLKDRLNDPIIRGAIAGFIGGTIMEMLNLTLYYFEYMKLWSGDFVIILLHHHKASEPLKIATGFIGHLLNAITITIILQLILQKTDFKYPIFKGAGIGLATNFLFLYLSSFLNAQQIINAPELTIFLYHITATIYGIIAGYVLNFLHQKYDVL